MSNLYIVAGPIGNLQDITFRALEVLKGVDLILCEDTRVTQILLDHYQIKTKTLSYHQHSELKRIEYIVQLLKDGKSLALVSDAGTPGISDPGGQLVAIVSKELKDTSIIPIPGPSAIASAASISGFPMEKFTFLGFPPAKRKRKKFFEDLLDYNHPVIFYESTYRILKALEELRIESELKDKDLEVVVCREMTKKFETIYRGKISEIVEKLKASDIRGEFAVIVEIKGPIRDKP